MRKFGFLFLSLLVVFIFFSGFYLYYVPTNKETQNKYAFLILKNIQSDLEDRINADIQLFSNHLQKSFRPVVGIDEVNLKRATARLNGLGVDIEPDSVRPKATGKNPPGPTPLPASYGPDSPRIQGELYDISNGRLFYRLHQGQNPNVIRLSSSVSKPLSDILHTHENDFYQSFLFLKIEGGQALRIFKSTDLSLGTEIAVDSLLAGSKTGFYPGIADVRIGDQDFKMFYIPVCINGLHFVVCGFKSTQEYLNSLHEVPPGFIYPIVIIFLLLLIILPLIKLYIMGPGEKVRIWDFIGYCFSLIIGSMLVTIIIIQVILLKDSDIRLQNNLSSLSGQVSTSFRQELSQVYHQLEVLDTLPEHDSLFKTQTDWLHANMDISKTLVKKLKDMRASDSVYYNFDRVSWIDRKGRQIIKGEFDGLALYSDVSKRKYFKDFIQNESYRLPGTDSSVDSAVFTMQPVFNLINGAYRIIVAKRSRCPHVYITTLSTMMYSFNLPVLPSGFGFCIIDASGNVQVHSDSSHNLNENFLDEVENAVQLKSAMTARQDIFVQETKFYGKKNGLLLTPLDGLPFYLVSFYDNGYILPVNMRILIFSLLFFFAFLTICLAIWVVIFWRRYASRPLLFSAIDYLQWIVPRERNAFQYFGCFLFLSAYIAALLFMTFLTNFYAPQNNYIILVLLLLTPLNITCGLIVTAGSFTRSDQGKDKASAKKNRKPLYALITLAIVDIAGIASYKHPDTTVLLTLIVFQSILLLLLIAVYFYGTRLADRSPIKKRNYLFWYTALNEALLVCLSVLPAGLFTWYSHNQEILQAVKKEQLSMAFSLENRKNVIYNQIGALDSSIVPVGLFDTLQYARGIYRIYDERIRRAPGQLPPVQVDTGAGNFYFTISDQVSNSYYDPGSIPALQQFSSDRQWEWARPDTGWLNFYYTLQPDSRRKPAQHPPSVSLLNIESKIPARYIYLEDFSKLIILVPGIFILLFGLYKLIRRVSVGIFLKKYVEYAIGQKLPVGHTPLFDAYCLQESKSGEEKVRLQEEIKTALFDYITVSNESLMNSEEQLVILKIQEWEKYYAFVLQRCSPREKYLLYSFALNGFLNYKNVVEIYHLLDEGIMVVKDEEIRLFSLGFRAYILRYYAGQGSAEMEKTFVRVSSWQSFKTPFMIMLIAAAAFIFFTRQEAWQRLSALITGISTSLPLLIGLFRNGAKGRQDS